MSSCGWIYKKIVRGSHYNCAQLLFELSLRSGNRFIAKHIGILPRAAPHLRSVARAQRGKCEDRSERYAALND